MSAYQLVFILAVFAATPAALAAPDESAKPEAFYRAAYLQTDERDYAAAADLFEQVTKQKGAPQQVRAEA